MSAKRTAIPRAMDLSARRIRQLEQALAELTTTAAPEDVTRHRAELVLAHLADISIAVLIANDRGRYVDANARAPILTGYTRNELLKMAVWDLTPTPRHGLGLRLWREFLRRGRMRGNYQVRRKNGTIVTARYVAVANVLPGIHVSALARRTRVATQKRTVPHK
jgi:PAS domain S-box-containing protein